MPDAFLRKTVGFLLVVAWLAAFPADRLGTLPAVWAQPADTAEEPWQLEADQVRYDQLKDEYVAEGNVVIQRLDRSIAADFIRFNRQTMEAEAIGNVVAVYGTDIMTGTRLKIDLEKETGHIENGTIFLRENNYHITGDRIEKTGPETYLIDRATITTCDGDKPAWKFTGRDAKIREDGSGSAKHAAFYVRSLPTLYFPYVYYPARKDRQTGFLLPEFSLGDRKGFGYNQPFFWAINDSQDATFYVDVMLNRGVKPGIEYRYYLSQDAKGAVLADGFHDDKVDDGSPESKKKYGYGDGDTDYPRPNRQRYWFRMSHHQLLAESTTAKLDLDLISDQDYLRDFKSGFMGFEDTSQYFETFFVRTLDDDNDPVRVNRLLLNRIWPSYSLNAETRWYQNVTRELNSTDTVQKLPFVRLDASKQKIGPGPFYFTLNSEYDNLWRLTGSRNHRLDVFPRIYYPWRFRNFFSLEPSVGARETIWYQYESSDDDSWVSKDLYHRELFDTRVELFTDFFRTFDVDGEVVKRVKHSLRPMVTHNYVPDVEQRNLPDLVPQDRVESENVVTYSLTNTLTSKYVKGGFRRQGHDRKRPPGEDVTSPAEYGYRDFLRLKVEQGYDLDKSRRPFRPILGKLNFSPGQYVSIDADASWSVYDQTFLSHNVAMTLWDRRGDRLFVEHRYDRGSDEDPNIGDDNEVESVFADLEIKVTDRLRLFTDYEYNLEENVRLHTGMGFSYRSQCWTLLFRYIDEPDDARAEVSIKLHGIGEFGF